jgi:hypothetical protein
MCAHEVLGAPEPLGFGQTWGHCIYLVEVLLLLRCACLRGQFTRVVLSMERMSTDAPDLGPIFG